MNPPKQMTERRAGCAKLLTELFQAEIFWGGNGGVVRISEAVAQGVGPRLAATDNRHGQNSRGNKMRSCYRICYRTPWDELGKKRTGNAGALE